MEDDKIKYSDIIQPDDSIEKLVDQLETLNKSYETTVNAIRAGADRIVHALKQASGATSEGRKSIDDATLATDRLSNAQRELRIAMSDTGKQIAWLKAQTSEQNRTTVEQQKYLREAETSYNRLNADLKQATELYKSLTAAERADSAMGQQLLQDIINMKNQIKALNDAMKPRVEALTAVQKAEQKLAYLESEEGKRLLELKAKIAELTKARHQQKAAVDPLVQAQEKLSRAQSDENTQLQLMSLQTKEANQIAKLQAQIAASAEGSYNRLSAQYALNKIRLNAMSQAEREATDTGKKLEIETAAIYQKMIKLQEATGNYRLSVGHYEKAWDGLGMSISQVVRELPAAAVSLNTFFLGISNNIPMVVDEINKLRAKNKLLQAEGKETVNITKSIIKSFFSWNTALVLVLTALSVYGKQIFEFIGNIGKAKNAVMSLKEAQEEVAEELKNTNNGYGNQITTLKRLQSEWKGLKTQAEKKQWIIDNKTEFTNLGFAIKSVSEAENVMVTNTDAVVLSLKRRAAAAAAMKLAADKYEKALEKQVEAEKEADKAPSFVDKFMSTLTIYASTAPRGSGGAITMGRGSGAAISDTEMHKRRVEELKEESDRLKEEGDQFFDMANNLLQNATQALKDANIALPHKDPKKGHQGRQPTDLTDTINKNQIKLQKQYEESVTNLIEDEYNKRKKALDDQISNENNGLLEKYRKNEEYVKNVGKKYKELTESQKKQIAQQQKWITDTIANNLKLLARQLEQVENEQLVHSQQLYNSLRTNKALGDKNLLSPVTPLATSQMKITQDTSGTEEGLKRERDLLTKNLDIKYSLIIDANRELLKAHSDEARSEEEIIIELNKKKIELWSTYDKKILDLRAQNVSDQLKLVQKGSDKELELLLKQNEIARQQALVENAAKPVEQQVSSTSINQQYDKSATTITGKFNLTRFEQQQALDKAIFEETKHNELEITKFTLEQEKERWLKQIELAESGGLEWSQAQIDAAKATVNGIDRQLSEADDIFASIGKNGLGHTMLEKLGFDDDQIKAIESATDIVVEQLQAIVQAEIEAAEQAVKAAQERVDAAQSAYDAEVEARSNGYANNVATAKKELEQSKKQEQEKQKILERAQRKKLALDAISQASNLVTASSLIWAQLGWPLAVPILAVMWGSFAAAKIKAAQVTSQSDDTYGDGGLEFLEGGSHASGNDIDLGTKNKRGRNMRAEGGEAMAIINKRQTRKYKKVLPDVINSLNKGVFEEKYLSAFAQADKAQIYIGNTSSTDVSKLERSVDAIRKQGEVRYYNQNGLLVIQRRNVKRIIHQ